MSIGTVCERFFWSLKNEWTNLRQYADLEQARQSIWYYLEVFYNRQRLDQALGYVSPQAYEADHAPATKTA